MTERPRPSPRPRAAPPPAARKRFGYLGAAVTVAGFAVTAYALTAPDWFTPKRTFADLHHDISSAHPALIPKLYFGWLAWTLCVLAVVTALAACAPTPATPALRVFGAVFGAAGTALTVLSIRLSDAGPLQFADYVHRVRAGYWIAALGFLAMASGAAIGPAMPHRHS